MRTIPKNFITSLLAAGWLYGTATAELLVSEDFDYDISVDAGLNGKGGTENGWNGAWSASSGTIIDVSSNPLSAAGVTGGNQALQSSNLNSNEFATRAISSAVNNNLNDNDLWISYLLRFDSGSSAGRIHLFNDQSNWDHRYFGADEDASGDFALSRSYNNRVQGGPTDFSAGDTVLMVLKLTSDGSRWTNHDVWINPTSEGATGAGDMSIATTSGWSTLPGLGMTHRSNAQTFTWDRFRVGETFADVAIPEPSSFLLVTAAAFGLLCLRRHRTRQ